MIRAGDRVYFKPEWQDDGDRDIVFLALEDEDSGRVLVQGQIGLTFNPTQRVLIEWVEHYERFA